MTRPYITPPDTRLYAIGDLHGHREPLARMIDLIEEDMRGRDIRHVKIVFLGDYVDRGPDSAGLLDDLIALQERKLGCEYVFLKGNHENGMLGFMHDPQGRRRDWVEWGGVETLQSYGIDVDRTMPLDKQLESLSVRLRAVIPQRHVDFLSGLRLYHICGDYLCVHAGIRPGVPLEQQEERDLTFIRGEFLNDDSLHPWRVVHGHTITGTPEILPNRINVDTGLYKNGVLSCAVIEGSHVDIMQVLL
jgi:serine/threonine protein phosphatase 1